MTDLTVALMRVLELSNETPSSAEPRRRARRRPGGKRTTLAVPAEIAAAAEALAAEEGTTPNDVLIQAMIDGMVIRARQEEIAARAEARRLALFAEIGTIPDGPVPTEEEHLEAALALRREFGH